jgi:hypothetical protein
MPNEKRKLPEWPSAEEGGGIHTEGGPDALDAGAWGTYEPYMADLELYLGGLEYPVSRDELINHVRGQNAPEVIMLTLAQLPEMDFSSAADISMGLADIE